MDIYVTKVILIFVVSFILGYLLGMNEGVKIIKEIFKKGEDKNG